MGQGSRSSQATISVLAPRQVERSPKQERVLVCSPDPQEVEQGPKSDHWDQQGPASHWILSAATPGQAEGSPKQVLVLV